MARAGHKYPLIVYRHLVSRWWTPMIAIGLVMILLAYSEYITPLGQILQWRWQLPAAVGGLSIFVSQSFRSEYMTTRSSPFPRR